MALRFEVTDLFNRQAFWLCSLCAHERGIGGAVVRHLGGGYTGAENEQKENKLNLCNVAIQLDWSLRWV